MKKIKVKIEQGIYEVVNTKANMEMFNDKNIDVFFVNCNRNESNVGFPMALIEKKDIIEVFEDE